MLTHLTLMGQQEELIRFLLKAQIGYFCDYRDKSPLINAHNLGDLRSLKAIAEFGSSKFQFNAQDCDYLILNYMRDLKHCFDF